MKKLLSLVIVILTALMSIELIAIADNAMMKRCWSAMG